MNEKIHEKRCVSRERRLMVAPQPRRARYEDFFSLPSHRRRGDHCGQTAHATAVASSALGIRLGLRSTAVTVVKGYGMNPSRTWVKTFAFPTAPVGAVSGCRHCRRRQHLFRGGPDWVCEVLSPAAAKFNRMSKIPHYAANGFCWRASSTRLGWLAEASDFAPFPIAALWAE